MNLKSVNFQNIGTFHLPVKHEIIDINDLNPDDIILTVWDNPRSISMRYAKVDFMSINKYDDTKIHWHINFLGSCNNWNGGSKTIDQDCLNKKHHARYPHRYFLVTRYLNISKLD